MTTRTHERSPGTTTTRAEPRRDEPEQAPMPLQLMAAPGVAATDLGALMDAGGNQGMVQLMGAGGADDGAVHAAAAHGTRGSGGRLPHGEAIQRAFGRHDVSGVRAHVGGAAAEGAGAMGATAYARGSDVAFAAQPDLHTAAHEAAHVVQQRAGVQLYGGVGRAGDAHERHADRVADQVVAGRSAEATLDEMAGGAAGGGAGAVQRIASAGPNYVTFPKGTVYFTNPMGAPPGRHVLPVEQHLLPTGQGASNKDHGELEEYRAPIPAIPPTKGYFKVSDANAAKARRVQGALKTAGPLINRWVCDASGRSFAVTDAQGTTRSLPFVTKFWVSGVNPHTQPPTLKISRVQRYGAAVQEVDYTSTELLSRLAPLHTPQELMQSRYFDAHPYERHTITRHVWREWGRNRGKRLSEHPPDATPTPALLQALGLSAGDWSSGKVAMAGGDAKKAKRLLKDVGTLRSVSELPKKAGPALSSLIQNEVKALVELRLNVPVAEYKLLSGNLMFALVMELERSKAAPGKSEWKAKTDLRAGVLGKLDAHFVKAFLRAFAAGFAEVKGDDPMELLGLIVLGIRRVAASAGAPSWFLNIIMADEVKKAVVKDMDDDGSDYVKAGVGLGGAGGGELQNPADRSAVASGQASYRRNWTRTLSKGKDGKLHTKRGSDSTLAFKYTHGDWGVELKVVKSGGGGRDLTLKEVEFSLERGIDLTKGSAHTLQLLAGAASVAIGTLRKHPALASLSPALLTSKVQMLAQQALAAVEKKFGALVRHLKQPATVGVGDAKVKTRSRQPLELAVKLVGKYDARGHSMELAFVNAASLKMSATQAGGLEYGGGARKNDPFYLALELEHTLAKATITAGASGK